MAPPGLFATPEGRRISRSGDANRSQWSFSSFSEPLHASRASLRAASSTRNRSQWAIHGWGPEVGTAPQRRHSPLGRQAGRSESPCPTRSRTGRQTANEAPALQRSASFTGSQPSQPRQDAVIALVKDSSGITKSEPGNKQVPRPFQPPPRSGGLSQRSSSMVSNTDRNIGCSHPSGADQRKPVPQPLRPQTPQPISSQVSQPLRPQTPQPQIKQTLEDGRSNSNMFDIFHGPVKRESAWSGPPAPQRAQNRTLHRGTQALPSGPMCIEGTNSAEYGGRLQERCVQNILKASYDIGQPHPSLSRTASRQRLFGHGSQVIPDGPMRIEGRNSEDYGSMYQRKLVS